MYDMYLFLYLLYKKKKKNNKRYRFDYIHTFHTCLENNMEIYNFKNESDFKKLERKAYDGTIDIKNFPPAEYKYFNTLCLIYNDFKFNSLSKETANSLKDKAYKEYLLSVDERNKVKESYKFYQDNIRKAELRLSDIEKSTDAKQIAMFCCEILGNMMGEKTFFDRQMKKLNK